MPERCGKFALFQLHSLDFFFFFIVRTRSTHNMKSCSQHGWLPRTAMVVLLTFCTFRVTYVLNFSAKMNRFKHRSRWPQCFTINSFMQYIRDTTHLVVHQACLFSLWTNWEKKKEISLSGFFFCVFFKRSYSIIGSQRLHPVLAVRASACSSCASKYGCLVTDSSLAFYRESVRSTTKLCSLSRCQALNMKDYIRSAGDVRVSEWLVGWTDGLNDTRVFSIMPVNTGWWIKHWTVLRFIVHNRRISAEVPQPFSPRRVYWRYPNDF